MTRRHTRPTLQQVSRVQGASPLPGTSTCVLALSADIVAENSRKGPFAGYYLQISPGGRSLLAGGKWTPDKNDLATIRTNIIRNSKPFRRIINAPTFVKYFGPAKLDAKGKGVRCNVFGADDMLKVAPKMNGVDKNHKDIDLLKLRTIGVVH